MGPLENWHLVALMFVIGPVEKPIHSQVMKGDESEGVTYLIGGILMVE